MTEQYYGPEPETKNSEIEHKASSKRLMLAMEALLKVQVGKVEVQGIEYLVEIPKDKKVILVVSHISDIDIPLAVKAVGNNLDVAIVDQSVHHHITQEVTYLGLLLAGSDNFIPVDFKKTETGKKEPQFNPDNFLPMVEAMENGKAILIAAHNPSGDWELEKGGNGAVYLAELTDAIIVPIGVNIKSERQVGTFGKASETIKAKRPDVEVNIGAPFELEKIEGIDDLIEIIHKRKTGERLTKEDIHRFNDLSGKLRE